MNTPKTWYAPAKINLFLRITAQRADGMHELQTAFQFIELYDELQFELCDDQHIIRSGSTDVPHSQDLCVKAAQALQTYAGCEKGVDIHITKSIPMGAGLGGASSDAATTLLVLNRLWDLHLSEDQLAEIGCKLGADVPVFIRGQAAWAEGVGERLTSLELDEHYYLVVNPGVHVSTAQMFADSQLTRNCPKLTICPPKVGEYENVFEPLVRKQFPQVDSIFEWLGQYAQPFMTGTGASVVAAFSDKQSANEIQSLCPQGMVAYVAQGRNTSPLIAQLNDGLNFVQQ